MKALLDQFSDEIEGTFIHELHEKSNFSDVLLIDFLDILGEFCRENSLKENEIQLLKKFIAKVDQSFFHHHDENDYRANDSMPMAFQCASGESIVFLAQQ